MEIAIIIMLLLIFVACIVLLVVYNRKKNEEIRYYAAAGNILREDFLNYALQNHFDDNAEAEKPRGRKMMIYLKVKGHKDDRFVFDPEKDIRIGRDKNRSNIFINDHTVSQDHCRIYAKNDCVYLKDCNSSNGTRLMRGVFGNYALTGGSGMELRTGDKIIVGSCVFAVTLFYYDMSQM